MSARWVVLPFFAALAVYYARAFVLLHQQAMTVVQVCCVLLAALAAVVRLPDGAPSVSRLRAWLLSLAAAALSVAIFLWADHDSHSVSDTLNRAVPAICPVVTIAIRLVTNQRVLTTSPDGPLLPRQRL